MSNSLFLHFRPRRVPLDALRFTLTWGLGGMAALMVIQQLITGLLLGFFYEPLPVKAYESVQHIQSSVFLGALVRSMHHWTGHFLVVVIGLHLLRIFFNGAFYRPRRRNWFVGIGLGILVLTANFSGYLLPWDQLSFWAVTIATSMLSYIPVIGLSLQEIMRGGTEVGGATLQIFYSIHTTFVPFFLFLLMGYHFWFVRKAGGILIPDKKYDTGMKKPVTVPAIPELIVREAAFAALVTCCILLFAMFIDAPLGEMANPELTPATVKAPWYFLGAQELLLHVHPIFAICVLPIFIALFFTILPFSIRKDGKPGKAVKTVFITGAIFMMLLTIIGIWFRGPGMKWVWPW